mmetsp:Transcript_35066/g.84637  ORF Transcript_35066/g.84637 Transcript_35066/m.84637 type:complete len:228 (-) Transcript_35066:58-741(-)
MMLCMRFLSVSPFRITSSSSCTLALLTTPLSASPFSLDSSSAISPLRRPISSSLDASSADLCSDNDSSNDARIASSAAMISSHFSTSICFFFEASTLTRTSSFSVRSMLSKDSRSCFSSKACSRSWASRRAASAIRSMRSSSSFASAFARRPCSISSRESRRAASTFESAISFRRAMASSSREALVASDASRASSNNFLSCMRDIKLFLHSASWVSVAAAQSSAVRR